MKCIFRWNQGDGYTYNSYDIIPFECDDLTKIIYDTIESLQNSMDGIGVFGIWIYKDEIDYIEASFFTLEDWFEKYKI